MLKLIYVYCPSIKKVINRIRHNIWIHVRIKKLVEPRCLENFYWLIVENMHEILHRNLTNNGNGYFLTTAGNTSEWVGFC